MSFDTCFKNLWHIPFEIKTTYDTQKYDPMTYAIPKKEKHPNLYKAGIVN